MLSVVARFMSRVAIFVPFAITGCASYQMNYNVSSYDEAIANSANELLLLNAVRASQRYPMSFTQVGGISAGPQVGGALDGTFNFNPLGLSTFSVNPKASNLSAGYNEFALSNLNDGESLQKLRRPISPEIIQSFRSSGWPEDLVDMLYVSLIIPPPGKLKELHKDRNNHCSPQTAKSRRDAQLCDIIQSEENNFIENCGGLEFNDENRREAGLRSNEYYNSGRNICQNLRFQILLHELRIVKDWESPSNESKKKKKYPYCAFVKEKPARERLIKTITEDDYGHTEIIEYKDEIDIEKKIEQVGCWQRKERTAIQLIVYLGDLIAAQNYSEKKFEPNVLIGQTSPDGQVDFVKVPLFVVKRGLPVGENAAITVTHQKETFFVPQPEFGLREEARSLQTLDFVLATVRATTSKTDTPTPSPVVAVRNRGS
jgi:hypothetical protein